MTFVMGGVLTLAPGSDRIPVELFQILTQYAICRLPALLQCMKVKSESEVAQSCPPVRDPMDCSSPGSSVHGIFQARVLEWVALTPPRKPNS